MPNMLKLSIQDFEGRTSYVQLKDGEYSIGRDEANAICLADRNVSRQHARIRAKNGQVFIENVAATYGTRFNNLLVREPTEMQQGDIVEVGDYKLELVTEEKRDTAQRDTALRDTAQRDTQAPASGARAAAAPPPSAGAGQSKGKGVDGATAIVNLADIASLLTKEPAAPTTAIPEASQPRMIVESENLRGLELRLSKTPITVGRVRESADLVIDHRSISKEHARLTRLSDGTWQVLDLGSANGIKVNGEPYSKSEVRSGDKLEFGHVTLRFLAAGAKAPAAGSDAGGGSKTKLLVGIGVAALVLVIGAVAALTLGKGKDAAKADDSAKAGPDKAGTDKAGPDKAGTDNAGTDKLGSGKPGTEQQGGENAGAAADDKGGADNTGGANAGAAAVRKAATADDKLALVDAKLTEGHYDEALPIIEAAKVEFAGNPRIAAKLAEVQKLADLKKKLDQAEKKLESDAPSALEIAMEVKAGAPSGSPLHTGAESVVEMAKRKLSGKAPVAAPKAADKAKAPEKAQEKAADKAPAKATEEPAKKAAEPAGDSKSPKELYDDAREALGASDWDRAISSAKQALKAGYKKANTVLAKAYWGKGDKGNCLKFAEAAVGAGFDDASMQSLINKCQ